MQGFWRVWRWPVLWAAVIFITSCTYINSKQFAKAIATHSSGQITETRFNAFWHSWWWVFVKGYHVMEFAVLLVLIANAFISGLGWPRIKALGAAILMSIAYAASDEYHQTFVKDRGGKVSDVLIDCIGILGAALVVLVIKRKAPPVEGEAP